MEFREETCNRLFPDCPGEKVCDFICGECRDRRPAEGEVCGLDDFFGPDCSDGLTCRLSLPCSRCEAEKGLGQRCFSSTNCEEDLQCWPFEQKCYPKDGEGLFPPEVCLGIYSPESHLQAQALGIAVAYSTATVLSAGVSGTVEVGGVYGPDGRYGCFITRCTGGEISAGVASSACVGFYNDFDAVIGLSTEIVESVGPGTGVQFSTSQVLSTETPPSLLGTADCFSIEAAVSPVFTVGGYACDTIVETFLGALTTTDPSDVAGDADGDGEVLASDALTSLRSAVGNELRCPRCVCDLNGSGTVTASDSLLSLRLAVGLEAETKNPECQVSLPTTTTTLEMPPALSRLLDYQRRGVVPDLIPEDD